MASELDTLKSDNAELTRLVASLRTANTDLLLSLWKSEDNYEALGIVHEMVCEDCNELSEQIAILKIDLDDMTVELEALSEEYAIAFDVLAEAGLIDQVEVDDLCDCGQDEDNCPVGEVE